MLEAEQVAEMAKILKESDGQCGYYRCRPFKFNDGVSCTYCALAKPIYNAGFRKVDGTHYISMEWHEEQVQHAQDEIENLKLQLQHAQENEEVLTKNAEEVAKQAVRDFAEYLQEYAKACEETGYDGISQEDIEEKMQQFWREYEQ